MSQTQPNLAASSLSHLFLIILSSLFFSSLFILTSCTKSSGLVGSGSAPSTGSSISGTVQGGLSTISGSTVSLYQAGNPPTLLATTTTNKDGTFNFTAPSSASGLLYLVVSGGNAGKGTNSSIQLMALAGTVSSPTRTLIANELTSAATQTLGMNMGLLIDSGGTISLAAAANQTGANNVITQYGNLLVSTTGQLNTSNSNLSTAMQNALNTMANAFASCVQNASGCTTLMSTSTSTSGSGAKSLLEAGFNMLSNSSTVASGVYTLAAALSSSTGFSIPATIPGGFSFNNPLAIAINTFTNTSLFTSPEQILIDGSGSAWLYNGGTNPQQALYRLNTSGVITATISGVLTGGLPGQVAIDANGNFWTCDANHNIVREFSSSGSVLGAFSVTAPNSVAIDQSGHIWITDFNSTVYDLNSSGAVVTSFSGGSGPLQIAIDASGNLWIINDAGFSGNTITQFTPAGISLGTFTVGTNPAALAFDPSGNLWVGISSGSGSIRKLSPSGATLGTFTSSSAIGQVQGIVSDQSGNIWATSQGGSVNNTAAVINSAGNIAAIYTVGTRPLMLAIDPSGNVWTPNGSSNSVSFIPNAAIGPQFFPFSGPQWPW